MIADVGPSKHSADAVCNQAIRLPPVSIQGKMTMHVEPEQFTLSVGPLAGSPQVSASQAPMASQTTLQAQNAVMYAMFDYVANDITVAASLAPLLAVSTNFCSSKGP